MKAPKRTNQEISDLIKGFDIKYGQAVAEFTQWLINELKRIGERTIKQIVDFGWKKFDVESNITKAIVDNAVEGAEFKIYSGLKEGFEIDKKALESAIKYDPWASDGRDLNSRAKVADTATRRYITEAIKEDFGYTNDYDRNLKAINAQVRSSGAVDEKLLRKRVRKMTSDIRKVGFTKDYTKSLKALEAEISTLSEMNYPSSETKKAYESFIMAVKGQNIEAFEKSVDNMVKKKARYISRRIARTETARAQLDSFLLLSEDDEDVKAYKWNLDASHNITDICDVHAKGDFGLGQGIFPKNKLPPIPAHPNCTCYLTEVIAYDDEIDLRKFSYSRGGDKLLKGVKAKEQNVILGSVERGKAFRKGEPWNEAIVGSPKPQDLKTRFKNVIKSKFI